MRTDWTVLCYFKDKWKALPGGQHTSTLSLYSRVQALLHPETVLPGVRAIKSPARCEHNEKGVSNCAWAFRKTESTYKEKYSIISTDITQISQDTFPVNTANNLFGSWKYDPYHEDMYGPVFTRLLSVIGLSLPQLVDAALNVTALMPRFWVIYFVYVSR